MVLRLMIYWKKIMNTLNINGYTAIIAYDAEIDMFRGEFVGLNGGADFYARDVDTLHKEAKLSLDTFLQVCKEQGIEPVKEYSGKFNTRIDPELHRELAILSAIQGCSINEIVNRAIRNEVRA